MTRHHAALFALGVAGAILSLSHASFAADTNVVQAPPTTVVAAPGAAEHAPGYTTTNVPLIVTGAVTFGLAYVPAIVIASQSSESADHNLYIPVAGPWMDIASRPSCGGLGPSCNTETLNKVLIGVDGVAQGAGALMTVLGLLTPVHHENVASSGPTLHVSPAQLGASGYGLSAFGTW